MSRLVLDSYALLASYRREPAGFTVEQMLRDATHQRWMSVVNLGEVYYRIAREDSLELAETTVSAILTQRIEFVDADRELALAAARIKARYPLSYADCFAAALAQQRDASVVTGDPEFAQLEQAGIISVKWLPTKPRTSRR